MKKILLIGDSIRQGYQAKVTELLAGRATVTGPADNCRFAAYTLFNLRVWVPDSDYDLIQWNNGQWDTCHVSDGMIHTPLAVYLEFQQRICGILKRKTRRLVFATTTPVWPEQFTSGSVHPRRNEDIRLYNSAAVELLGGLGAEILDLYSVLENDIRKYISEDMVHLTEAGKELCARSVVGMVEKQIQASNGATRV